MEKFIIQGGKRLEGEVEIGGAKNAALPIMAASLLGSGRTVIRNVPQLTDVKTMANVLRVLGAKVIRDDGDLTVDTSAVDYFEAPYELVKTMRASVLVMGPLLGRAGRARVSRPGGCAIGPRLLDQHLKGLTVLGVQMSEDRGYLDAKAKDLKGAEICLDEASVTATENILMAAVKADGVTTIINAAREPHVCDLARFLNEMGGRVEGAGSNVMTITGVEELRPAEFRISPDYVEAGTFMIAAAMTGGNLLLKGAVWDFSKSEIRKLQEAGVEVAREGNGIRTVGEGRVQAVDVKTFPFPGFPTDLQPQMTSLLATAQGTSLITETMYENRFTHIPELMRMGASIRVEGRNAVVQGVGRLWGANVMASDIRAGAALILAGLATDSETHVSRIYHIDRGYERIEEKLKKVGAAIERVEE